MPPRHVNREDRLPALFGTTDVEIRIAAVARRPYPGIFQLEGPALCLLNTQAVARDAARLK